MRPRPSRAMWRSLTRVKVPPSGEKRTHSVSSVAVKGALGIGGMTMLSSTSRTPPSEAGPGTGGRGCCDSCVWAKQTKLRQRKLRSPVRIQHTSGLRKCYAEADGGSIEPVPRAVPRVGVDRSRAGEHNVLTKFGARQRTNQSQE